MSFLATAARMVGATWRRTVGERSSGRAPLDGTRARSAREYGTSTWVVQLPSAAVAVWPIVIQPWAVRAWTSRPTPLGGVPSGKTSRPATAAALPCATFWRGSRMLRPVSKLWPPARARSAGSWAYRASPGQLVEQPSRWPDTRSNLTMRPLG